MTTKGALSTKVFSNSEYAIDTISVMRYRTELILRMTEEADELTLRSVSLALTKDFAIELGNYLLQEAALITDNK